MAAMFSMFSAMADVIFEPQNDFYSRHRRDCADLRLNYFANGENGFVSVKKEPGSDSEVTSVENGEIIHIYAVYSRHGETGGFTNFIRRIITGIPAGSPWAN